jgi:hypothetical protein
MNEALMTLVACKTKWKWFKHVSLFSNKAWDMIWEFWRVRVFFQPVAQFDPNFSPLYCFGKQAYSIWFSSSKYHLSSLSTYECIEVLYRKLWLFLFFFVCVFYK